MKIRINNLGALILFFALVLNSCTIETSDGGSSSSDVQITGLDTDGGWIYGDLFLQGLGLDANCENNAVTLSNETATLVLDISNCSSNEIVARIPADAEPGLYNIIANIDGDVITAIDGANLEVEVRSRPIIFSLSKTTMQDGETITIDGLNLLNPTSLSPNDPKVWIMKSGYTNTVSDITVDSDGKGATVVIDDGIDAGEYRFLLTTDEWSNAIAIIIE